MPVPRKFILNDKEKHLTQVLEAMVTRTGGRVLYARFLDAVDWDEFRYPEVVAGLEGLIKKELIRRDDQFITRQW
jgi:hypothetical protein